jgi:tetratricopeptide (TPR) repeat protein
VKRLAVLIVLCAAGVAYADEPRATWQAGESPHAGVPFELRLVVEGLDESPQPDQPKLAIQGAQVKELGAQPNVSRMMQVINGRRSDFTQVTWVFRWSVTPAKEGVLHIPSATVAQGSKHASVKSADTNVEAIPTTDSMKLELALPSRPVFVGENIPVTLTWLFRAQPQRDPQFQVPMLDGESFTIGTVPATNQHTYKFSGGDKALDLPYKLDRVEIGGQDYNRLVATFYAAPKKTGKIEVPAASVVAAMPVGRADFFGNSASRLFRSTDVAHTLEVKPLPETDRPAGFAGAVGTQFSMAVATSRSVVSLGEPVELAITVKSDQRLDTLALPKLDREGGLPKDKFTVPAEAPTGELSDDGKTKTFKVTAQVTGPANEIPALAFSYFDPIKGQYQTVHSDPIALSVKGGSVVGAGDVIAAAPTKSKPTNEPAADLALVGADLALSSPGAADTQPMDGTVLWLLLAFLYIAPLAVLGVRSWQVRTRAQREEAAEARAARKRVEDLIARAAKDPARDTAGALASAIRAYARALEREVDDGGLLAQLETESFAPSAADSPLSADMRVRAGDLMRRWATVKKPVKTSGAAAALVLVVTALGATRAHADPTTSFDEPPSIKFSASFDQAREAYEQAMTLTDPSARKAAFSRAAAGLARVAADDHVHPELLADWGNAALGAGDIATATLAYRRALAIDGRNVRARKNLAWLRSRQPDSLRPAGDSAADALFFFHQWPHARRLFVGACAFALAVLLVVPWTGRRRKALTGLAILPLLVWLAMTASVLLEDRHTDDAVLVDAVVLRAADSAGAPAATAQPLPRGTEVTIVERRDAWTRVRVASGTAGWVQSGSIVRVGP